MGTVADTSLRALQKEIHNLRFPLWLQRHLFFRKAKGTHGVHSPLAYRLATEVFMKSSPDAMETRLQKALPEMVIRTTDITHLAETLTSFPEGNQGALWVTNLLPNRTQWLTACADERVTLAIDCFDCGLLLRTPDVKAKQYLRQRSLNP